MPKKEESKAPVMIGIIGHVDTNKETLQDSIKRYLETNDAKELDLSFPIKKEIPKLIVNPPIEDLIPNETEYSFDVAINKGKEYIKPETLKMWEEFCEEYKYFYSGLFIKRLVNILMLLHEGATMKETEEYLNTLPLNKELINYICIALIRFSNRGFEFYEKFYCLDVPEDEMLVVNEYETAMCRMLTKKAKNN